MRLRAASFALLLSACGSHQPPAAPAAPPPPLASGPSQPPAPLANGRLPATARPTRYELMLDLDPARDTFTGTVRIALEVANATRFVVLHARELKITSATLGGRRATATPRGQELVITTDALVQGSTVLELAYEGAYSKSLDGLYKVKDALYTDFEPVDARKMFPCFDEPSYKAPYRTTVRVPKGQLAFSNAPEKARHDEGQKTVFEFEETPPLPSYLVAVTAGKLAVLEGPKSPWPIRVIARPEALEGERGKLALVVASETLSLLEKWFEIPYPYKKLDLVAVPDFGSGAMENAGLVTFREELLLVDPAKDSRRQRRSMETVITHELAHQWFGDLVTTAWWDDIWLNEGFASFMEAEILDEWKPGYGGVLDRLVDAQRAMELDAMPSARKVRQPVVNADDAREAFDPITYDKGSMVLAMTQSWLGKPSFQKAVSTYVKKHAGGNATASDLFAELDAAGSLGSARVSSVLVEYLDQPGVPWVGSLGSKEGAWLPRGVAAKPGAWSLVHCHAPRLCTPVVAGAIEGFHLGSSYARGNPALAATDTEADKLGVLWSQWGLLRSERGGAAAAAFVTWAKAALVALKGQPRRQFVESVMLQTSMLMPALEGTPRAKEYRTALAKALGPTWSQGAGTKATDSDEAVLGRRALAYLLADFGAYQPARSELRAALQKTLAGVKTTPDAEALAYELGTRSGDKLLWDKLHAKWQSATSAAERTLLLRALLGFDDDAQLERTLGLALEGKLPVQDLRYVIGVLIARPNKVKMFDAWTQKHWKELQAKFPPHALSRFSSVFGALCSKPDIDASKAFYVNQVAPIEGAKRNVELAEQAAHVCSSLAAALTP